MKSNILKFDVVKEEITPENVLEMSEVIAFAQTRFLIGYMGTRMQKLYAEVCADIKHKKDIRRVFSDGYDLVQEGALYLCEHYGRRLNDVIGYTKKGKAVTIRIWSGIIKPKKKTSGSTAKKKTTSAKKKSTGTKK